MAIPKTINPQNIFSHIFFRKERFREIENYYEKQNIRLMNLAALALFNHIIRICKIAKISKNLPILIVAGKGNNGGDAIELANIFLREKIAIEIYRQTLPKSQKYQNHLADYQIAYQKFINSGGNFIKKINEEQKYSLIIEGIFGIGFNSERGLEAPEKKLIRQINNIRKKQKIPTIAIDIASGLDSESGRVYQNDIKNAICADYTISLIAHKAGMFMNLAPSLSGKIILDTLAVDNKTPHFYHRLDKKNNQGILISPKIWQEYIPQRYADFHKGIAGNVLVLAGLPPMSGAGELVSKSSLTLGCGRVYWENERGAMPEIINALPQLDKLNQNNTVIAIGPGLGNSKLAYDKLEFTLKTKLALVIDADAINILAADKNLQKILISRSKKSKMPVVLTPHPLEAARLLGVSVEAIQNARIDSALKISKKYNAFVLLKGCGSVVVSPQLDVNHPAEVFIANGSAVSLATAGSGDVLCGAIASFLAQGLGDIQQSREKSNWQKLKYLILMAVDIHLIAGKKLAKKTARGTLASEIILSMRKVYNSYHKDNN